MDWVIMNRSERSGRAWKYPDMNRVRVSSYVLKESLMLHGCYTRVSSLSNCEQMFIILNGEKGRIGSLGYWTKRNSGYRVYDAQWHASKDKTTERGLHFKSMT